MAPGLRIIKDENAAAESCGSAVNITDASERGISYKAYRGNVALITLGCAKNQVDSEVMLGVLESKGFQIVSDVNQAEIAIVNTCGFLESSINESIDCVLDVSKLKETGRLRKVIVAGCMVERYKGDIRTALPEVDSFVGLDDILNIANVAAGSDEKGSAVQDLFNQAARPYFLYDDTMPRKLSTLKHTAYVKVSEGCDRPCTFCIIPKIRGAMRSRSIESVVSEIKMLGKNGVKEINLVAQDLTSYGKDRKGENLKGLLKAIDAEKSVNWVRLLYAYPIGIDQELLRTIADSASVCNYLDLPLQHSSENVLRLMQRPVGRYAARNIIKFIKDTAPEIKMRTTFIVGFPGETEEDIQELVNFVSEGHFSSVGVFTYSKEEGTPSFDLEGHVSEDEKASRRERVMLAQQQVVESALSEYIGKTIDVLIEGSHEDTDLLITGRAEFQAPEVDGSVIINDIQADGEEELNIEKYTGRILPVTITEVQGYDLIGKLALVS